MVNKKKKQAKKKARDAQRRIARKAAKPVTPKKKDGTSGTGPRLF
jgi:hypothetical protein